MVKLGDICSLINGDRGKNYPSKDSLFSEGIPFINAGNLNEDLSIVCSGQNFITEERYNLLSNGKVQKGDILFCLRGSLGKFAIVDSSIAKGAVASSLVIIRPLPKLNLDYLKNYLRSSLCKIEITRFENGAAQPNLSAADLRKFEIPMPFPDEPAKSLVEQKRIAAILDKADAIRRKRKQAIKLADDFLRSVFLDMFGDPVTNPKGWEVKKFGDLGHWASGGTPTRSKPDYFEGEINWFSARELNHRYLTDSIEKITDEALNKSATKIFPAGSMLVGMYDTAAFKISILNKASASNQACANIIPNDLLDIEWFFSFIEFSKETYLRQRRGVRQKNLNLGMIKGFELPLPPKSEQMKFVHLAKKTLLIKEKNYLALTQSEGNFNSLSQKAFAGEL